MRAKVNRVLRRMGVVVGETAEPRHDPEDDDIVDTQDGRPGPVPVLDLDPLGLAIEVERPTLAAH